VRGLASILHADLDSFYASVEQRDDPRLRGRPVIVGAGIVLAATYEARACGVYTPMGCRDALRLCPDAVVVPPRMAAYTEASRAVFAIFEDTTPVVEPVSVDEAFLEVGGLARLAGTPEEIGQRLRRRVRAEVGLPISVGVARTRFLAKVASRTAKPDGLLVVPPDRERAFLDPLPVSRLWGVGPRTAAELHRRGLVTVRDVAAMPEPALVAILGKASGRSVHALAHNRHPQPVQRHGRRSVGAQAALGRRPRTRAEIDARLAGLVDRVTRRLRRADRLATTVTLRLRLGDLTTRLSRSHTLPVPTASTEVVLGTALALLHREDDLLARRGLTLVGVTLAGLTDRAHEQLVLPLDRDRDPLDSALDRLRDRFGSAAVTRGSLVGCDQGFEVPMLPDQAPGGVPTAPD
jgi:DNA polymerase-4